MRRYLCNVARVIYSEKRLTTYESHYWSYLFRSLLSSFVHSFESNYLCKHTRPIIYSLLSIKYYSDILSFFSDFKYIACFHRRVQIYRVKFYKLNTTFINLNIRINHLEICETAMSLNTSTNNIKSVLKVYK